MKQKTWAVMALILSLYLAACGPELADDPTPVLVKSEDRHEAVARPQSVPYETLADEQGAVSVAVTPINLAVGMASLDFQIAMNTHSVDLSMDIAPLSTLATDAGRSAKATTWSAAPGGHHVSGVLSFPSTSDGMEFLSGASKLILTIRNVDAPERVFTWELK